MKENQGVKIIVSGDWNMHTKPDIGLEEVVPNNQPTWKRIIEGKTVSSKTDWTLTNMESKAELVTKWIEG